MTHGVDEAGARELYEGLVRLREPAAAEALAGTPGWERDPMPFDRRLPED